VVLVARDLEATVDTLCNFLGAQVCFRDPAVSYFGLQNALLRIGDQFLEIVSPTVPEAPAARYMERRGEGGYMVMVQVPALAEAVSRAQRLAVRVVWEGGATGIRGAHLHPSDMGGAIVSVDEPDIAADWPWAGPDFRGAPDSERARSVVGVTIACPDPHTPARQWSAVLGAPLTGLALQLDRSWITFCEDAAREPRMTSMACAARSSSGAGEVRIGDFTIRVEVGHE
jgi:hypothetical protein